MTTHHMPPQVKLIVKESSIAGKGCFADEDIASGTKIGEYYGPIITFDEADDLYGDNEETYLFSIENNRCIDATHNDCVMKYINHCCDPNCESDEEDDKVFYYAKRDIKKGEELTVDYQLISDNEDKCFCGTEVCRGTMRELKLDEKTEEEKDQVE